MQNNNKENSGSFKNFFKDKGYYIVLILCLVAVGISGYVFVSSAVGQKDAVVSGQESLSVPTKIEDESKTPQSSDNKSTSAQTDLDTSVSSFGDTQEEEETPSDASQSQSSDTSQTPESNSQEPATLETAWPIDGSMLQSYSIDQLTYNATMQDWRTHNGIDIAAELGQTVMAAADGTVTALYEDDYLGTTVVLSHGNGYTTRYCNLNEETSVQIGDTLKCGDAVGTVGQTALLEVGTDPHLHFEVYKDNASIDPVTFLS